MDAIERKLDAEKQQAVKQKVEVMADGPLFRTAALEFCRMIEGDAWWDLVYSTGMSEAECRKLRALADVVESRRLKL